MLTGSFRDLQVGQVQGSRSKVLSQDVIEAFAEISEDRHPLHLDEQYAAEHRFGRRIAHGALLISTFLGLVELDPRHFVAFYGIDRLRFIGPTFSGDTIHAETEVVSIEPRPRDGGEPESAVATYTATVFTQRDKPVMVGQFKILAH
ncbi:MaoC family dehydratase [Micrococcus terreus]|uniref:MaoC family dehydratase n=1 Tax=Micrococcus terreus TaxID=574650 RepID=UPI0023F6A04A|nr:MaoC/PaaZ C-terminal domain-containing protein [Micrococcus terreus]